MPRPESQSRTHFRRPAAKGWASLLASAAMAVAAAAAAPASAQDAPGAPLTLAAAIREAMAGSEEARLLREKERKFAAVKQQAWSGAFPRITATATVGRGNTVIDPSMFGGLGGGEGGEGGGGGGGAPMGVFSFTQDRFAYGVEAQQSLFTFGRLGQAIRTAQVQEKADVQDRKRGFQELQLRTLDAYYAVVTSRAHLASLDASLKRSRETVAFLESNWRMGAGLRATVLRAITDLKSQEPQRIRAERDAESARMNLNRLLGRPVEAPLELDTTAALPMDPVADMPRGETLEGIVESRPDVQALALNRKSLEGQARFFKMMYLPSLGANGKIGVTAYDTDQLAEFSDNKEWQVGVGLTWTLFDGFDNLARARQIESDARSLRLNEEMLRKGIRMEIESAYRDYRASDTALAAAEQAVQAAREAQEMLSEEFRAGKGQITDLLAAEEALRQAEIGVLAARYQRVRSQAALRLALGKGLINEEAK